MRREGKQPPKGPSPHQTYILPHSFQPGASTEGTLFSLGVGGGCESSPVRLHHSHFLFPPQPKVSRINSVVSPQTHPIYPSHPSAVPQRTAWKKTTGY